jgi:glycosyltransferase involved in cell wall biosynthesis
VKVALVTDWYRTRLGGIELHLEDLAHHLQRSGHEVVVITPTPGDAVCGGVRVHRIYAPRAPRFGFLMTPGGVRAVGRAIAEERPDVAHCHVSIISPAALGGAAHALAREIPTVLTFHSIVPQTPMLARAARAMLGTARWPALFTAVSARVATEVRAIAAPREMRVLANGIDASFWRVEHASRPDARLELISVMRLNPKKRPLALVAMMQALRSHDVRLRIVGDGPLYSRLASEIRRSRLGDSIELLGRRSREDVRMLLSQSHAFVLPTVRESFGLAALEARCAGVPVVAMAASGVAEFIEHGLDGLLARSDTELAEHVASLARDRAKLDRLSRAACELPVPHDWPRVIDAHLAAYREAIALRVTA